MEVIQSVELPTSVEILDEVPQYFAVNTLVIKTNASKRYLPIFSGLDNRSAHLFGLETVNLIAGVSSRAQLPFAQLRTLEYLRSPSRRSAFSDCSLTNQPFVQSPKKVRLLSVSARGTEILPLTRLSSKSFKLAQHGI